MFTHNTTCKSCKQQQEHEKHCPQREQQHLHQTQEQRYHQTDLVDNGKTEDYCTANDDHNKDSDDDKDYDHGVTIKP